MPQPLSYKTWSWNFKKNRLRGPALNGMATLSHAKRQHVCKSWHTLLAKKFRMTEKDEIHSSSITELRS